MPEDVKTLSIAERLGKVAYRNQGRAEAKPHILVDTAICNSVCPHKCTTYVCPANCYTLDETRPGALPVRGLHRVRDVHVRLRPGRRRVELPRPRGRPRRKLEPRMMYCGGVGV